MKNIKIHLDQIEVHKQEYDRCKQNLLVLKNTKVQLNDNNDGHLQSEIDELIEFCEFSMDLSVNCIVDQIRKIESKSEGK